MKSLRKIVACRRYKSSLISGAAYTPVQETMTDLLVNSCERNDSQLIASFELHKKTYTFGEMFDEGRRVAAGLLAMGVKPGDKVAIWGPNQPEWLVMKWACSAAGLAMVNINPLYTARELEYALDKVDAKLLVCPKTIGPLNYDATIRQMIPDLDTRNSHDLNLAQLPMLKKIIYYSNTEPLDGTLLWSDLEAAGDQSHYTLLDSHTVRSTDIANIQFTSGTTGMPKAASLSHYNLTNNARAIMLLANSITPNFDETSTILNILPLYHVFSFVGGSLVGAVLGVPNIYPAPGFNAALSIKAVAARKPTHMIGTPTMFTDIVNDPTLMDHDMSSLSYAIVGGAPVTPALVRTAAEKLDLRMCVGYGMTENTCATFLTPIGAEEHVTCNTVGFPIGGLDAKIIDTDEKTLQVGEIGELCTRGFTIFQGYVADEEKTRQSFTQDGFFKTGDLAVVNEDGTVSIAGRSKDMIIRGGENIQPTEIENYICTHPNIQDCYVVGVPSMRLGEEVAAYIKLKEGLEVSMEELVQYCHAGLARYKVPKYSKFVTEYPQTVTGKVKKFELQKGAINDFPELAKEI